MKSKLIVISALSLLIPLISNADPICSLEAGNRPDLSDIINRADAIVVLRVESTLSDFNHMNSFYSTHECMIYQTLKGDIPKDARIELQLYNLGGSFATPYAFGSHHLIFLVKNEREDEPTDYRMITMCGAQTLLPPLGLEKMPEGNTIKEKVENLIKDAIAYQTEEYKKRMKFLRSMLNQRENSGQLSESGRSKAAAGSDDYQGDSSRLSGPIVPLPEEKVSEMFKRIRQDDEIDLRLIYQALIGSQTALRAEAARYLGTHGDDSSIPHLIDALSDQSIHDGVNYPVAGMATTRYWANDSLKKLTGLDFGFVWDDPIDKRNEAINRWRDWYRGTRKTSD